MDNIHQNKSRVTPYNPNPQWPYGYFEVLEEAGIPKKQHSFYAQWVRQFFNAELKGRRRRDLGLPDINRFIAKLKADEALSGFPSRKQ